MYSEITENLQALDPLEISDYRFWLGKKLLKGRAGSWCLRVEHALHPQRKHPVSIAELEKNNFLLERILLSEDDPVAHKAILELCRLSLEYFLDTSWEVDDFLVDSEELFLKMADLQTGEAEGLVTTYADWCFSFWKNTLPAGVDTAIISDNMETLATLDANFELLVKEIDTNISRYSPELNYRYLQQLHTRFSRLMRPLRKKNSPPEPELLSEKILWGEPEYRLAEYKKQVLEYLYSITVILNEKLGKELNKIRGKEPLV